MSHENSTAGSMWDHVMTDIIDGMQFFNVNTYRFQHELTTMNEILNNSPGLM